MSSLTKEAGFSEDYREAQVRQIMQAVYRLRSIAVTGLAGMGKSNLVRFIVSHQETRVRYLKDRANDFAFVHMDGASFRRGDEEEIFGEMATQVRRAGLVSDPAPPLAGDPQESRHRLKEHLLQIEPRLNLVIAFDYFDQAAVSLDASFYNFLFHLRNARPLRNLSYIFVTRRSLGNLYELQELLDDDCVVGPFVYGDALASLQRDEARLGVVLDAEQRDRLIVCTGGHPGFLKNAAELLADGRVDASLASEEMARQLLSSQKVTSLCRELWDEFTTAEREVLARIVRGIPLDSSARSEVECLERNGTVIRREGQTASPVPRVFCPLFERFVCDQNATSRQVRIIAVFPNQARIETTAGAENITLAPKLFALLKVLVDAGGRVLRNDELIAGIYGVAAVDVSDAALSRLVKRLRDALNPRMQKLTGDRGYDCVQTVRDVGYRFIC